MKKTVLDGSIPFCLNCGGLVKPSIIFFGENLPLRYFHLQENDSREADLLLCIGTSLEVFPFAGLADLVTENATRILINREAVGSFGERKLDIIIKGDIVKEITSVMANLEKSAP